MCYVSMDHARNYSSWKTTGYAYGCFLHYLRRLSDPIFGMGEAGVIFPLLVGELCGLSATQEISLSITVADLPYGSLLQLPFA